MKTTAKGLHCVAVVIGFSLVISSCVAPTDSSTAPSTSSGGDARRVEVSLTSGRTEAFKYEGFSIGGQTSLSVRDSSCVLRSISKGDMSRIVVRGWTWAACSKYNAWEWTVHYSGTQTTGHTSGTGFESSGSLGGTDLTTGTRKSIKLADVREVVFR